MKEVTVEVTYKKRVYVDTTCDFQARMAVRDYCSNGLANEEIRRVVELPEQFKIVYDVKTTDRPRYVQ